MSLVIRTYWYLSLSLSTHVRKPCTSKEIPQIQQEGAVLDDEALMQFVDDHKNKNTKRKTQCDLRKWYNWCEGVGEMRKLGCLNEGELDRLLGHFFTTVQKKDGALYESDTLSAFPRSIDRHLTLDLKKTYNILRDPCFTSSRQALKASRKCLCAQGKGNKPNASEGLQSSEIER